MQGLLHADEVGVNSEEGKSKNPNAFAFGFLVGEGGFEPPKA